MMDYTKVVVVPVKYDRTGKVLGTGYHNIYGVYPDTSSWLIATIDNSIPIVRIGEIVKLLVGDLPFEIDPEHNR